MIHITVDVEEYNWPALRGKTSPDLGSTKYSCAGNNKLLKLFKKHRVQATFFVTGTFATQHPDQIREIHAAGHEIASHGFVHHYRNNPALNIEEDVTKSKKAIEDILGKPIIGFRSPQVQYSTRLVKAVAAAGFAYDSSLHPAWAPGHYSRRNQPIKPFKPLRGSTLLEIPCAVEPKTRLPISWGAIRTLGAWWAIGASKRLLKLGIHPNLYVHSLEFVKMKGGYGVPHYYFLRTGDNFLNTLESYIKAFPKEKFSALNTQLQK